MCHLVVACSGMVFLRARKRNRKVAYWVHAFHRPCIRRRLGLARHECGAYRTSMEPGGAMGATFVRVAMRCMAAARRERKSAVEGKGVAGREDTRLGGRR